MRHNDVPIDRNTYEKIEYHDLFPVDQYAIKPQSGISGVNINFAAAVRDTDNSESVATLAFPTGAASDSMFDPPNDVSLVFRDDDGFGFPCDVDQAEV